MSRSEFSEASVDQLVSVYAEAAAAHMRASANGDYEAANAEHDRLAAVYREFRERGRNAQSALLALLDHPDRGVRGWAGAHSLEFSPAQGEAALTELAAAGGIEGFDAEATLAAWRAGKLHLP